MNEMEMVLRHGKQMDRNNNYCYKIGVLLVLYLLIYINKQTNFVLN